MRVFTLTVVMVMAIGLVGCAEKREEELPQIDPAELEAATPTPALTTPITTAEVETPTPALAAVPARTISDSYAMQRGDTLYGLARRYYGDGKLWTRIAEANRDKFRDVTAIPVGTVLVIPPK
jgi:5'-nucleotidase/UDP-sugar diphosphatase